MKSAEKIRIDNLLVTLGHYNSRARARDALARGCIKVDGKTVTRAGTGFPADANLEICDEAARYVSRAALKLLAGLEFSHLDPAGKIAVDIGASTGGFTQVLVERGAAHVYAIDVGHGQMDHHIAANEKVCNIEGLNARAVTLAHLDGNPPQFIVSDVSFISLKKALPAILQLASPEAEGMLLVKPQFEVGKNQLGKGGIVRDKALARQSADDIAQWLQQEMGWRVVGLAPSPITGGDGNQEYLLAIRKNPA